ncbi:uncharacterized protein TNCV_2852011 [Trichonephila clavipes]|nr:uncharacterized protein TNCV_2852011 [Trichonephila clavipes]
MLIRSSDYKGVIENSQLVRNPAVLRESSKEEVIINSTDSKPVCSHEVGTDLLSVTCTHSLSNVPNENLVAVEINASNIQTNGQHIKESKRKVTLSVDSLDSENNLILFGIVVECCISNVITLLNDSDEHVNKNQFQTVGSTEIFPNIAITLKRRGNITDFVIIRKTLSFVDGLHRPGMTDELFKGGGVGVEGSSPPAKGDGRALDWFEVLGYRVVEDKAMDYASLKQALSEHFPLVRNRSELETRFYSSSQKHNQ